MSGGYTPGWGPMATGFMARRTAATHAAPLLERLRPGMRVLDVGCGPGTITAGIAAAVGPAGAVTGVDRDPGQVEQARRRAAGAGHAATRFAVAEADGLPFADGEFDAAFAHAVLEHVPDPVAALREMARVVRPGGHVVAVSPDWDGFILAPADPAMERAIAAYRRIQTENGGDVLAGRRLGEHARTAGLAEVGMGARYECYEDRAAIAGYLAERIAASPEADDAVARGWFAEGEARELAAALRAWAERPGGLFAQAWVWAAGRVPPAGGARD